MEQTSQHHSLRNFASTEEVTLPTAPRDHTPSQVLHQAGATGYRETYYAYHLGREVQQHHQRLFATPRLEVARQ